MLNQGLQPTPCPECGAARLRMPGAVELWITGMHVRKNDPDALVCTQCGYIAFYATPLTLAQITQTLEQQQLAEAKKRKRG